MAQDDHREPNDDDDSGSLAADEPTAIWDADMLRAAGLGSVLDKPESMPAPPATAPTDASAVKTASEPSMVFEDPVSDPPAHSESLAPPQMRPSLESVPAARYGWGAAVGAGALFFGLMYALIRFLR